VIDTPPHAVPGVDLIARTVDFLVIRAALSVLDLAAISSSVHLARASGKPAVFVLNACDPRAPEVEQSKTLLAKPASRSRRWTSASAGVFPRPSN